MERTANESAPLSERSEARRDLVLASIFTLAGVAAILIARGGIGAMIAGSVGTIGSTCAAIGIASTDSRLSYLQKVQAGLGLVAVMVIASLSIHENAFAFAGYPLATLGVAGLLPGLRAVREGREVVTPRRTAAKGKGVVEEAALVVGSRGR